ncbi:MAG TPA: hypothetical protein VGF46_09325 [Gaiellales bacterium]
MEDDEISRGARSHARVVCIAVLIVIAVAASIVAGAGRRVHHITVRRQLTSTRALDLAIRSADVSISPVSVGPSTVEARESWTGGRPPSGVVVGIHRDVELGSSCPSSQYFWPLGARCSVRYAVRVPGRTLGITMQTGDLTLSGIAGTLSATLQTGDLRASALRATAVTVHVGVGDAHISFSGRPASVGVQIGIGDASVLLPRGRYDIVARASVGDVRIGAGIVQDPTSARRIVVRSNVGDVHLDADG